MVLETSTSWSKGNRRWTETLGMTWECMRPPSPPSQWHTLSSKTTLPNSTTPFGSKFLLSHHNHQQNVKPESKMSTPRTTDDTRNLHLSDSNLVPNLDISRSTCEMEVCWNARWSPCPVSSCWPPFRCQYEVLRLSCREWHRDQIVLLLCRTFFHQISPL